MTPSEPNESESRLRAFLRPLRRPRGEAQWTQMIGSIARADPAFAGRLVSILVAAAPRSTARDQLGLVPERLICTPEYSLTGAGGRDLGRVDLRFANEAEEGKERFELFAELKLGASYGWQQLERYIAALDASWVPAGALVAITTVTEQLGEEAVANDPRWLGSIRWSDVFDDLRELDHLDPLLASAWRASLDLLREQGDFGPMDLDETAVTAWARRDDAETILRYLLGEMAQPALKHLREALGAPPDDSGAADLIRRGQSAVIWPWRNQMHLKYKLPGATEEERLRLQFLAAGGKPFFTIEARYDHPKETGVLDLGSLKTVRNRLGPDFKIGNDGYGYYWARVLRAGQWLRGNNTLDQLLAHARENIERLAASGIFTALAELKPSTPASVPPVSSDDR